jgi:hypothetical protein
VDLNVQLRELIGQQEAKEYTGKENLSLNSLGDTSSLGNDSSPLNCITPIASQGNNFSAMGDRQQRSTSLEKYCKNQDIILEQASEIIVEKKFHKGSGGSLGDIKEVNETQDEESNFSPGLKDIQVAVERPVVGISEGNWQGKVLESSTYDPEDPSDHMGLMIQKCQLSPEKLSSEVKILEQVGSQGQ